MRFASVASGSSGNCTYIGSEATHILIDAGTSTKRIREGLNTFGLDLDDIDAIFITHEHSDHISALPVILKKYDIPIYATAGTIAGILSSDKASVMEGRTFHRVRADERVLLKDLRIDPLTIAHDAAEPVCYRVGYGNKHVAVATDMGCYNDYIVENLRGMDALLLESNHDVRMVETGPYPYPLKRRILGDRGHLSNEASGELLTALMHDNLKAVLLGHLSDKNNLPELAFETVRAQVELSDTPYHAGDFRLMVAGRHTPSEIVEI